MSSEVKIPKTIHYIWFGGKPLPPMAERCISSWKEHCPDYEIVRWDEDNFDSGGNRYFEEALAAKKWAFASDYARLKVLVEHGGIYMDTDVEVLHPLDRFLEEDAFSGFETPSRISTGLMACRRSFPLFERLLRDYEGRAFVLSDGSYDETTNVVAITNACLELGLELNGGKQTVEGFALYPKDYFSPKDHKTRQVHLTENTYVIHHFDGTWLPDETVAYKHAKERLIAAHPKMPYSFASGLALLGLCIEAGSMKPYKVWTENRGR
ncbi:MAG: glycosyltransferase [Collinsella sp.]|nr:glycosyltransferase [Collinsella sp.]